MKPLVKVAIRQLVRLLVKQIARRVKRSDTVKLGVKPPVRLAA
ncbi:MAG: hypothetical protein ACTSVD_07005 [Candidatus Thorarchaeota archaeon]